MLKKEKQRRNQKRQAKRGQEGRERRKKFIHYKRVSKLIEEKPVYKKIGDTRKVSLKSRIKSFIHRVTRLILKVCCFVGIHSWKICAGREGDPMYACWRCWKRSEKKWGKEGSKGYYDKKHEDKLGVSDPENWEKKDGNWYFKGKYIELDKESQKRLKIILKGKKDK